jgi:hypothetical protein
MRLDRQMVLCVVIISMAGSAHGSVTSLAAQAPPAAGPARTDKGLYMLRVVEPGYDVTVKELDRSPGVSVLEMTVVQAPTITSRGTILFRAIYDIAKERKLTYVFMPRVPSANSSAGSTVVTKVFMTDDKAQPLKDLMRAEYSEAAQKDWDQHGYMPIAQLALLFGGRGG